MSEDFITFKCPVCSFEGRMPLDIARYYLRSKDRFKCEGCNSKIKLCCLDVFQKLDAEEEEDWVEQS